MKFKSNLHTHTTFSDGRGSPEETIQTAINKGFISLGISDHTYCKHDEGYCISLGSERKYFKSIRELSEKYASQINVFCGIELDSLSERPDLDFDYIIASVHNLIFDGNIFAVDLSPKRQCEIINAYCGGSKNDFAAKYFDRVVSHVEKIRPDIVGHFDLITKYSLMEESDSDYIDIALEALRETAKYCRIFEVNTGAMARGLRTTPYPAEFLLRELLKLNCDIVITSDAHYPDKLDFAFDDTALYLKKIGFTSALRLTNNGFVSDEL